MIEGLVAKSQAFIRRVCKKLISQKKPLWINVGTLLIIIVALIFRGFFEEIGRKGVSLLSLPHPVILNIDASLIGSRKHNSNTYTVVFLAVTISNPTQEPFTPTDFTFQAERNGLWIKFQNEIIPDGFQFGNLAEGILASVSPGKDLSLFNRPISKNEPIQGFLMYASKDISADEMKKAKGYKLICSDISGKKHETPIPPFSEAIGSESNQNLYLPKHGFRVMALPKTEVTAQDVEAFVLYYLDKLRKTSEATEYIKKNPNCPLVYPEEVQFLITENAISIIHWGQVRKELPEIKFLLSKSTLQRCLFQEDISLGKAALKIATNYAVFKGLVLAQKEAYEHSRLQIDRIGGYLLVGDRLLDISPGTHTTFIDCYFHCFRNNKYESKYIQYLYILGSTDRTFMSKESADNYVKHLASILQSAK